MRFGASNCRRLIRMIVIVNDIHLCASAARLVPWSYLGDWLAVFYSHFSLE